jgi:hypothetical protein
MPKGTKVHRVKRALEREGASEGKAIRIAQSQTGKSYKTGKTPKRKESRMRRIRRKLRKAFPKKKD